MSTMIVLYVYVGAVVMGIPRTTLAANRIIYGLGVGSDGVVYNGFMVGSSTTPRNAGGETSTGSWEGYHS